jgi:hypothetical protein
MVELAQAFGYGSPPYTALVAYAAARGETMPQVINRHLAGFQGGQPLRATPQEWGYHWTGATWLPGPGIPVGGQFNPSTGRFE